MQIVISLQCDLFHLVKSQCSGFEQGLGICLLYKIF